MTKEEQQKLFEENIHFVKFIISKHFKSFLHKNFHYKEDLLQEGLIGLHKATLSYNEDKGIKFSTFSFRCIYNELLMFVKKVNRKDYYKGEYISSLDSPIKNNNEEGSCKCVVDTLESPVNFMNDVENRDILQYIFDRCSLTEQERLIIYLREVEGYDQWEIGKIIGISQSGTSRKLRDLNKKLYKELILVEEEK